MMKHFELLSYLPCLCNMVSSVKFEKSVDPLPGNVCNLANFCDSNVSFATVKINGRTSYTSSRNASVSSDNHAPRSLMVAHTKY